MGVYLAANSSGASGAFEPPIEWLQPLVGPLDLPRAHQIGSRLLAYQIDHLVKLRTTQFRRRGRTPGLSRLAPTQAPVDRRQLRLRAQRKLSPQHSAHPRVDRHRHAPMTTPADQDWHAGRKTRRVRRRTDAHPPHAPHSHRAAAKSEPYWRRSQIPCVHSRRDPTNRPDQTTTSHAPVQYQRSTGPPDAHPGPSRHGADLLRYEGQRRPAMPPTRIQYRRNLTQQAHTRHRIGMWVAGRAYPLHPSGAFNDRRQTCNIRALNGIVEVLQPRVI
ncbi:hypothetical protein ACVWWN_006890 [Mycobacterium sp. URHB0021]